MPSDEEIRSLCARVIEARGKEFEAAVKELQMAIDQLLLQQKDRATAEGA